MAYLCKVIDAYKNKKLSLNKIFLLHFYLLKIINYFYNKTFNEELFFISLICLNFEIYKFIDFKIKLEPYTKYSLLLSLINIFINYVYKELLKI